MSYSDFSLPRVQADFGLAIQTATDLFKDIAPAQLESEFQEMLNRQSRLALAVNTEKARSEWLIAPLLGELWRRDEGKVSIYSGVPLDVDAEAGLVGRCDFLIGRPPQLHYVTAPLLVVVVEAKNEDIAGGLGQCAAAMVAVQRFNQRQQTGIDIPHGCVSDGTQWKFLRLAGTVLTIDLAEYQLSQADHILAILMHLAAISPKATAA